MEQKIAEKTVLDMDKSLSFEKPRQGSVVPAQVLEHSADADEAMKAFADKHEVSLEMDEATNKRILRRIDLFLLPIMCIVYMCNFLDKTTLSYASIMGLRKDIGLVGNDYQWLASMFYFGYLGAEYLSSRLLQRLPLGKFSAAMVISWGIVLSCFAAVGNFGGAVAIRFFLGVCESAVTPGFALLTSQWYTKAEQGARTSIWFSFNGVAQIVGGLITYGIARGVEAHPAAIAGWKIVFLLTGLLTVAVGVAFLFLVPDNQLNARWLSKGDRILAIERIRKNQQGVGNKHWKMYQFKEALTDPLTWMFVFYALVADIPNGGITNFFSQLIVSFGYTPQQSLLYGCPAGAIEIISLVSWGLATQRYPNMRLILSAAWLAVALLGIILIVALPAEHKGGRLAGYYLTNASATPFVALLSMISTNVAGYTKKTTVAALYLIAYCTGNIIGPQTFRPKDAPRYVPGEITIIICFAIMLCTLATIRWYCLAQNKKKAAIRAQPEYMKLDNQEFLDLTDRENPEFEYIV